MSAEQEKRLESVLGAFGAAIIRVYLRLCGRTVRKADVPWLLGPIGPEGEIGDRPYHIIAEREGLVIDNDAPDAGLLPDFDGLTGPTFDVRQTDPSVRRFYEHTAEYDLDVWSETRFPGRLFLWLIVSTVSRYMNQLNFPVFGLETSRGMTSEVIPLRDAGGRAVHVGWQRRLLGTGRVIYTGFYSIGRPPNCSSPCVKVVFPLPRGNATVFLRPGFDHEAQFKLESSGNSWGDSGFYRVLELDSQRLKVRYLRSLRERFKVYVDQQSVLRCDHEVRFIGMTVLSLHYRIRPRARP